MAKAQSQAAQTILIVEDSNEDFEAIKWAFKNAGINLPMTRCRDGDDALDFLRRQGNYLTSESAAAAPPSLIWLDLNLPGTNGHEVLDEIKRDEALKMIPVIVVTTSTSGRDIKLCYQEGANSYVVKPTGLPELLETVRGIDGFWLHTATLPEEKREQNRA